MVKEDNPLSPSGVGGTESVLTVQNLKVSIGVVVIADEAKAVSAYGYR